ncbi:MAG TPA: hypothetical protein VF041_17730, partial [Gemmatimonadaceae bacterium]
MPHGTGRAKPTWTACGRVSGPLLEALEPVCQRGASLALVREPRDEQRERLDVPGDPERAGVRRIEPGVADEPRGDRLRALVVAAVDQAGAPVAVPSREKTPNSTSLGTLPSAETTAAPGTFRASASAPEDVWAT